MIVFNKHSKQFFGTLDWVGCCHDDCSNSYFIEITGYYVLIYLIIFFHCFVMLFSCFFFNACGAATLVRFCCA